MIGCGLTKQNLVRGVIPPGQHYVMMEIVSVYRVLSNVYKYGYGEGEGLKGWLCDTGANASPWV